MNQLLRAAAVGYLFWVGLSIFKNIVEASEEEDLARHGAGESDYQRKGPDKVKKAPRPMHKTQADFLES